MTSSAGDLVIRPAAPADRAGFLDAALRSWLDAYAELLPREQVESAPAMLERAFEKRAGELRVAIVDGGIVGFYSLGPVDDPEQRNYLWHVYVDPRAQRRGVGRALTEAALAELAARGETRAWLDVLAGNAKARAFYAALGWSEIGRDASGEYELVILERELR
ncbi:MAG: GNAT family N-acetyltransferase [Deltaproteobacteria bacterium]|nr:GNAT family N-acetyltransferase [Deltaproteobacteria bacterium]